MLRLALVKCVNVKPIRLVVFRTMATNLKDFNLHYDMLEIHPECTKTEIREAWLRLSMQYHPNLNKDNPEANEKFWRSRRRTPSSLTTRRGRSTMTSTASGSGPFRVRWRGAALLTIT